MSSLSQGFPLLLLMPQDPISAQSETISSLPGAGRAEPLAVGQDLVWQKKT